MKKDKKAPAENLEPQENLMDKDYQQEEDQDVKEKHKITKIIIAVILAIIIFFIILLIWNIRDKSKEIKYDVNGIEDAAAAAAESTEDIEVDGCLLDLTGETVDVTIPLKFFEDKQPGDQLTEEQKASGYTAVKKAGGNVIYTIKTSYYPSVVSNLYEFHSDEYQEKSFLEKNKVLRFAQFQYMQRFTVTIDEIKEKNFFSPDDYYDLLEHTYYQSAIYQSYLGTAPADIKVVFQFKYIEAQSIFVEYNFPDMIGKNLSTVPVKNSEDTKPHSSLKASRFGFDDEKK